MSKLRAGSLQLVTFISLIIALLLSCFILLIHNQKQLKASSYILTATIQSINEVIPKISDISLSKDSIIANINGNSISYKLEPWGVYQKLGIVSKQKHFKYVRTALLGSPEPLNNNALFLKDHNKPLVLVGDTKIEGNAYLPESGVQSGNIGGQTYLNSQFIYGNIETIKQFPKLQFSLKDYIENISSYYDSNGNYQSIAIKPKIAHHNSFESTTQIYSETNPIILENITLKGNIVIQSYSKITIRSSSNLRDILLIAPVIEIEDNTEGIFQAFANEKISIGENCSLKYPSSLVLVKEVDKPFSEKNSIDFGSNSKLTGNIILLGKKDVKNYNPQLIIQENSEVKGNIYCLQTIELLGKIFGTVYTDSFVTRANGVYYQNHLLNVEINRTKLENEFIGLSFENSKKHIAKWMY